MTMRGDGTVPHSLGLLEGVTTFYVDEEHSALPANTRVIQAMNSLLTTGTVAEPLLFHGLNADVPDVVRGPEPAGMQQVSLAEMDAHQREVQTLRDSLRVRGAVSAPPTIVTPEEARLQDFLFRGMSLDFDADEGEAGASGQASASESAPASTADTKAPAGRIRIHVVCAGIESLARGDTPPSPGSAGCSDEVPIDAIAVGHYVGVKPLYAELAIDRAISGVDLIITEFTERGTLRGELGQPFLIPDPTDRGAGSRRVIVLAGMGPVGRFGVPEAAVLARELCWSLSRLGKRHLATVLIGAGAKNLSIEDAVSGWMQGVQRATMDCSEDDAHCLEAITFTEFEKERAEQLKAALAAVSKDLAAQNFMLELCDPPAPGSGADSTKKKERQNPGATRITAELRENVFRFGAITDDASIPEREVSLNPKLVFDVNDLIAAERAPGRLSSRGEFLRRLLVPRDLEGLFSGSAPIVLACDSTLARIHWELLSQPHPQGVTASAEGNFLGLCRGFTRQLRTAFAPAPEPAPPANRKLRRSLIVAPTSASDMPLPGARAEALAVRRTFEAVNETPEAGGNKVEVISMIGPNEANWALVMEKLLDSPPFDVLHYAGHCFYNANDPESSGWIFSNGNVLSARELARVDRIPKLVFSNTCESGLTPSRSELRSAALAPSFAEAFFARGVGNFVCTAWPVEDGAARDFAIRLYSGMLGLAPSPDGSRGPEPMFKAMREARRVIMKTREGRNWGAYQHYGNPFFQLFR